MYLRNVETKLDLFTLWLCCHLALFVLQMINKDFCLKKAYSHYLFYIFALVCGILGTLVIFNILSYLELSVENREHKVVHVQCSILSCSLVIKPFSFCSLLCVCLVLKREIVFHLLIIPEWKVYVLIISLNKSLYFINTLNIIIKQVGVFLFLSVYRLLTSWGKLSIFTSKFGLIVKKQMLVCIWLKLHALNHAFTVETNPIVICTNKLHWICTWNMLIFMHIYKISLRLPKDCHFHPPLLEADVRSPFAAEIFGKGKLTIMEYSWSRLKMRLRSTYFI